MTAVVVVSNVSKSYRSYSTSLKRFANWFGFSFAPQSEFWAVRDVSFSVHPGEAVALIGQNGAGKSTILKMLTGTVRQSSGSISISGTVGAILELGIGFNPEFTGRENILNAGGLLGHSPELIYELLPSIEEFAEIGEHFDKPLRTYSSGMQARLAFALVTAVRPDVLIVDEILSVGDSYFQHKSFDRIRDFKDKGSAIILVTHGLSDVRAICDRVLLLDQGRVIKDGSADEVVDYYNAFIAEKENAKLNIEQRRQNGGWVQTRSGTKAVEMQVVNLCDAESGLPVTTAMVGQNLALTVRATAREDVEKLVFGCMIRDRTGHIVWGSNTWYEGQVLSEIRQGSSILFRLEFGCELGPGSYGLSLALTGSDTHLHHNFEWFDNSIVIDVVNTSFNEFIGSAHINGRFSIERLNG